jgi:putrescine transport system substrate-binding protein
VSDTTRNCRAAVLLALLALAACSPAPSPQPPAAHELNLYTWSDFFPPDLLADFTKETGIQVHLVLFPSQEALEATMLTGHSNYDVVVVGGDELGRLAGTRVFRELNRAQLPNWRNLDPEVMAQLASDDVGNRYAVAYDWTTTAIALNVSKLEQVAPDVQLDRWQQIFDPATLAKLSKCGVSIVDARSELVAIALIADGKDPNTTNPADLEAAGRKLMAIRPYVRKIDSDMQITDFASGDICLMVTWSANFVMARRRAAEVGSHDELRYVIPREGTDTVMDALAIPADAPHAAAAYAFINYLMRADIAARGADFVGNATANLAAWPLTDKLLREDANIYPPTEVRRKLVALHARPEAANRSVTRIWTQFRTGH